MNTKGIKKIMYLLDSHVPWMPGKIVLSPIPIPALYSPEAIAVNVAIMKMMNHDTR